MINQLKKYILTNILLVIAVTSFASAATLSVQVVQVDKGHTDVTELSLLIEESIMDYFFSDGMIVLNSPIITSSNNDSTNYASAMNDARSGSVNYLAYITLFFNTENSTKPEGLLLQNIETTQWQLIRVSDNKQIASGKFTPKINNQGDNSENGITRFAQQIAAAINSSLK